MKQTIKDYLTIILKPCHWLCINTYSQEWDEKLNILIKNNKFENIGEYRATIGGYNVWVANHPYGSMCFNGFRPKRITVLRAHRKMGRDLFNL